MPRSHLTVREGRVFGLTLSGGFAVVAVVLALRGMQGAAEVLAAAALISAAVGVLVPRHLGPVRSAWFRIGEAIGRVTTPVVLSVIYFVVVTPLAIVRRALRRGSEAPATHWRVHEGDSRRERLQRQF